MKPVLAKIEARDPEAGLEAADAANILVIDFARMGRAGFKQGPANFLFGQIFDGPLPTRRQLNS